MHLMTSVAQNKVIYKMEIYMKYKLFVGQSQPNVKIMLYTVTGQKNNSSTDVGACVLILVDLLSNIQIYV